MILELATVLALAKQCAPTVAPETLLSIVRVESRFNPLAINVNGAADVAQPKTRAEAIATAEALIRQGRNIDLGLGQINSGNLGWLKLSVADAFDPCRSLSAAGRVLEAGYVEAAKTAPPQQALRTAFSRYNTGHPTRGFNNGYVAKVEAAASYVVPAIGGVFAPADTPRASASLVDVAKEIAAENTAGPEIAPPPAWDVFARSAGSAVQVFGR